MRALLKHSARHHEHLHDHQRRRLALALYVAVADEQGIPRDQLSGTTQNDIIKEYLSRAPTYSRPGLR
jgi:methylmalonyl-CoA mutase N-terminal domain/subunit